MAAVMAVDPLDDFLTAVALEIHVNIRRFLPFGRDEPLEQQARADRVNTRDSQDIADGRVRGRSPPLTDNAKRAGMTDNGVHGQKIRRVGQRADQPQLVGNLRLDLRRCPGRVATR